MHFLLIFTISMLTIPSGSSQQNLDGNCFIDEFPLSDIVQYIRSDTEVNGNLNVYGSLNLAPNETSSWLNNANFRSKVYGGRIGPSFGGNSLWSHFPFEDQNTYIRPGDVGRDIFIGDLGTQSVYLGSTNTSLVVKGTLAINSGTSDVNPDKLCTYFRHPDDGKNYIRGDTEIRGNAAVWGSVAMGPIINSNDPWTRNNIFRTQALTGQSGPALFGNKYGSYFPAEDQNTYIRPGDDGMDIVVGETQTGNIYFGSSTTETWIKGQIDVPGASSAQNPSNLNTQFNNRANGMNYIRGDTIIQGDLYMFGTFSQPDGVQICLSNCYDVAKLARALDKV